jgi:hypothetical protein
VLYCSVLLCRRTGVKWIHARTFGGPYPAQPLETTSASLARAQQRLDQKKAAQAVPQLVCKDDSANCKRWSDDGEVSGLGWAAGGRVGMVSAADELCCDVRAPACLPACLSTLSGPLPSRGLHLSAVHQ